jgi:YVTN family beta-propeller protein
MDETPLRDLLRRLGDTQQPPAAVNLALARARGRRRLRRRQAGITATALAAVAVPALLGTTLSHGPAAPQTARGPARGPIAYVTNLLSGTVTPIRTATNTALPPVKVGRGPVAIAITPDGKTAYVVNSGLHTVVTGTVTPIRTATNTALPPVKVGRGPVAIAITP